MELIPNVTKTSLEKRSRTGRLFTIAIVGLVAGIGIGYFVFSHKALAPDNLTKIDNQPVEVNATLVIDQQMPGPVVLVRYVEVASSSWIAIHEDKDGEPGNILGALLLRKPDAYTDEQVPLLRDIEENKIYYAIVHNDDGDGQFDYKVDRPRKDGNGSLTKASFEVISTGSRGD